MQATGHPLPPSIDERVLLRLERWRPPHRNDSVAARLIFGALDMVDCSSAEAWLGSDRHEELLVRVVADWLRRQPEVLADPGIQEALKDLKSQLSSADLGSAETNLEAAAKMDRLRAQGHALMIDRLAEEGGSMGAEEVGRLLGITPQAVHLRRREKKLLGVKIGREYLYPRWQFQPDGQPWPLLVELLPSHPAAMWVELMLSPHLALPDGRRPLDLLRAGEDQLLRELASVAGEQVSW